ncbi:MAG TPA: hypothetical protein VMG14_03905 [Thermoplasmata archaeon]|nr:hypothetical protein [Thermoplasmata archaeon]HTW76891.1 hypothetical protein [Thermoplasmata archaeon]
MTAEEAPVDYDEPVPPPRPKKVAYLAVATDVLAAVGLVAGIIISGVSLYTLIAKYRAKRVQPPPGPR